VTDRHSYTKYCALRDKTVAITMHCNLRLPAVALVVLDFNYDAPIMHQLSLSLSNFNTIDQCATEFIDDFVRSKI